MRLTARVPATAANLGPGFDCFGLALDLCNEVTIDTSKPPGVSWEGEGAAELPTDGTDMVSRAMRLAEARISAGHGVGGVALPPFHLHGLNRIPLARGLGSSAAAAVAGVAVASRLLGVDDPGSFQMHAFVLAHEIEGHPDNAAAAALGGLTVATGDDVERLDPHPDLRPVALIPEHLRVATGETRHALPDTVTRADAVFNIGHAALTLTRLLRDPEHLRLAMQDRLHQEARLALVPEAAALFRRVHDANVPVCVSGSGPTLLAFERERWPIPDPGADWRVLRLSVRGTGVEVSED